MNASYEPLPRSSTDTTQSRLGDEVSNTIPGIRHSDWLYWLRVQLIRLLPSRPLILLLHLVPLLLVAVIVLTPVLNPSYVVAPAHYTGKNPRGEQVFIAACIVDPDLIRGAWGKAVLELIDAIGADNVFLSIYENDSGPDTRKALEELSTKVFCNKSIVSEHLPLDELPAVTLPSGEKRTKRITYLAEIRNRAMRPFYSSDQEFDKVLYLNDVVFSGPDAANLLFGTRAIGPNNRTQYRAACAVDFINPVKFYDTFATRDLEGYGIGVPFFPWFSTVAGGASRADVLHEKDSVRVKSCWGGMVAFDTRWFLQKPLLSHDNDSTVSADLSFFRAEEELFWEASECCLIHADLQANAQYSNISQLGEEDDGTGIYMNPFIRVAYSESAFWWLKFAQRFERLYILPHRLVTWIADLPWENPRRTDAPGEEVVHKVWTTNIDPLTSESQAVADDPRNTSLKPNGCFREMKRIARPGGFCGSRKLQYLREHRLPGEKTWTIYRTPPLSQACN